MDWTALKHFTSELVKKYKYVAIVLLAGLVLMLIPSANTGASEKTVITQSTDRILTLEQQLSQLLSNVKGAGEVQVMLTVAAGEETFYQTNDDYSVSSDSSNTRTDTVTVSDANRNERGLVRQVNPPTYLGAIIVCQGADVPAVRLAIVEAVSKATGLGADKISVLKMK